MKASTQAVVVEALHTATQDLASLLGNSELSSGSQVYEAVHHATNALADAYAAILIDELRS